MNAARPDTTSDLLDTALRTRVGPSFGHGELEEISVLARTLAGTATVDERARASLLLQSDGELAEAVLVVSGAALGDDDRSAPRRPRAWASGLTLLAAGIAGVVVMSRLVVHDVPATLVPKGARDHLSVAVERRGERLRLHPDDRVEAGDRLGLFYSAARAGHLFVVAVDAEGGTAALYPASGAESAPISVGEEVAIPDGVVADEGRGCEWIVAVFSDGRLDGREVDAAVRAAPRSAEPCRLELAVPGARSVHVFPVRR